MNPGRIDRLLMALYPRQWRARYGEELTELLAQMRDASAWRIRADLARAACGERLRSAELLGDGPAPGRVRGGSLAVLWAWAVFVVAGCAVQKYSEHWSDSTTDGRVPAVAFGVLTAAAVGASVLVAGALVLAVPRLMGGLRSGLWPRLRSRVRVAVRLSVAAVAASVGLVTWASNLSVDQRNGSDLGYAIAFVGWAAVGAACLLAWTAVAAAAARRIELSARVLRVHALLCGGVTTAMGVMTAATLTWWIALSGASPGMPVVAAAGMAVATMVAAAGSRRAAGAARELDACAS